MASCDVLALFTTPIHSSIKDSTYTFDGSHGCCSESDQLHWFEGKKSAALPTFGQRNGSATLGTFVLYQRSLAVERQFLLRLYELKNEVEIFLRENKNNLHDQFHNEEFVVMLAYLADVFGHLHDMNLSSQSRDVTVSDVKDRLAELTARKGVWQAQIKVGSSNSFPLLETCLKMNRIDLPNNIKTCIIEHLEIVSADHISTTTRCMFHGTKTRFTLKLALIPNK